MMKNKFILVLVLLFACSFAHAQDDKAESKEEGSEETENTVNPNIIKINPLGLLLKTFNASYEHPVAERGSIVIGVTYFDWSGAGIASNGNNDGDDIDGYKGFCGRVEYRQYVSKSKQVLKGLFVGPTVEMGKIDLFYEDGFGFGSSLKEDSSFVVAIGAKGGYQWVFNGGVTLDLSLGYARYFMNFEEYEKDTNTILDGSLPSIGFGLGYNF